MKKLLLSLALVAASLCAQAGALDPADVRITQNGEPMIPGGPSTGTTTRYLSIPATGLQELIYLDGTTRQPGKLRLGTGLAVTSGQLTATAPQGPAGPQGIQGAAGADGAPGAAGTPGATTWAGITDKPTTFAPSAHTHLAVDISDSWPIGRSVLTSPDAATARTVIGAVSTSDTRLADARTPLAHTHVIGDVTGLQTALNGKFANPAGTTSQYLRGDGSLGTMPSGTLFNFSLPAARTIAVGTSYQASDPTKAAIIVPSYACQNSTTVLASSACTLQVRMGTGTLTCSTGTVYYTQSLTVGLGLLLTQSSTNPVPINLPIGASFIVCSQAGTFTVTAVEQSAG